MKKALLISLAVFLLLQAVVVGFFLGQCLGFVGMIPSFLYGVISGTFAGRIAAEVMYAS